MYTKLKRKASQFQSNRTKGTTVVLRAPTPIIKPKANAIAMAVETKSKPSE
jgi:hypothetical protein